MRTSGTRSRSDDEFGFPVARRGRSPAGRARDLAAARLALVDRRHARALANPVGARLFGAANATALAEKTFGPTDGHRRQIIRLAGRLPANGAIRLERLRGFG